MDVTITSAIISAAVATIITLINYLWYTPYKERQSMKKDQLKNLYAPMYGIIVSRIELLNKNTDIFSNNLRLGSVDGKDYLERSYMEEFILKNAGYASDRFVVAAVNYISNIDHKIDKETYDLVTILVKDYQQLKKDLKMNYNERERQTGIPENISELENKLINKYSK